MGGFLRGRRVRNSKMCGTLRIYYQTEGFGLSFRRGSFYKDQHPRKGQDSFFKTKRYYLYKERQVRESFRVWQSISSGPNRWKFYCTLYEHFIKNERQGVVNSYYQGASTDIWSGSFQSVTTDKGYYSRANVKYVEECTGNADGIQRPANIKDQVQGPQKQELYNRRAGVEPLIGHIKRFGLGKSKMKSDRATLSSGYRSISGFNLHQLMRGITKNMKNQGLDGTTLTSNFTSISGFNPHQMKAQGTI